MMKMRFLLIAIFTSFISSIYSQELSDGGVAFSVPVRNSFKFNRYVLNPTFSFVRESNSYISLVNKRQWLQFENPPQTFMFGYTGRLKENQGASLGLFQQNIGKFTVFGGMINFAQNVNINDDNNLTFGLNAAYVQTGLNTSGLIVNSTNDVLISNFPSTSTITIIPGINYGTSFLDFGVSLNNLVIYNLTTNQIVKNDPSTSIIAHFLYTGYMNSYGLFDQAKFSGLIRGEISDNQNIFSGIAHLSLQKGFWGQVGYNTQYGVSGGIGFNITKNICIEYNYEKGLSNFADFGSTHEFLFAYRFNKKSYYYSDSDEDEALFQQQKFVKASNTPKITPTKTVVDKDASAKKQAENERIRLEREAAALKVRKDAEALKAEKDAKELKERETARSIAERQANDLLKEAEAFKQQQIESKKSVELKQNEAKAKAEQERLAKEAAAKEAKLAAEEKAKAEQERLAKEAAEKQAKLAAEAKAKAEQERLAKEAAEKQAKLAAEEKAKAELERLTKEAAEKQAKLAAEAKAKAELERLTKEAAEKQAKLAAEAKAKAEQERLAKEAAAKEAKLAAEAKAKAEQERLAKEAAEKQAKLAAEAKAKAEQERLAKETAAQEAKLAAEEKERLRLEQLNNKPNDEIAKNIENVSKNIEGTKIIQEDLIDKLKEKIASKQLQLDNLKQENDLKDKGIVSAPKEFVSTANENKELEKIKSELEAINQNQNDMIDKYTDLYDQRVKSGFSKKDEWNQLYLRKIEEIKLEQKQLAETNKNLLDTLDKVKLETEIERKRRIKLAVYQSDDQKFNQDMASFENIKNTTPYSSSKLNTSDLDFGDVSTSMQILKDIKNTKSGYYLIIASHTDVNKRDDFAKKVVATGDKNINFFYDIKLSKYYIYTEVFDTLEQARQAIESKRSNAFTSKMNIIKIEN
jgi:type IX secretion system PorP/SprF family membrane protein